MPSRRQAEGSLVFHRSQTIYWARKDGREGLATQNLPASIDVADDGTREYHQVWRMATDGRVSILSLLYFCCFITNQPAPVPVYIGGEGEPIDVFGIASWTGRVVSSRTPFS